MYYELTDHFQVQADLDRCWEFFSTPHNLAKITPPWLNFTVAADQPLTIQQDSILDYTIRWLGIPIRWRTRIIDYSPPRQFIDLQIKGPYALWHHQHRFETAFERGTNCFDRVIYRLPVPIVRRVAHALTVKRQLMQIFLHRRKVIGEQLGWARALQNQPEIRRL